MQQEFTRLVLVFALGMALTGVPTYIASGQQKNPSSKPQGYPVFVKVYSKDGRESLTAMCTPVDLSTRVNEVSCKFTNVRFIPPEEQPSKSDFLLSLERQAASR